MNDLYSDFRRQYEEQHPSSVPVKPEKMVREYPWWLRVMVGSMFVCAALLSGVHTVPTVYGGIEKDVAPVVAGTVALLSFVAVELAIFTAAYMRRKAPLLSLSILAVTFAVALVSNLSSLSRALSSAVGETASTPDVGTAIVTIALGIGAPLIALMSGEMFVHITASGSKEDSEAIAKYRDEMKRWDATINAAYTKHREKLAMERLSAPINVRPQADTADGQHGHGSGYVRASDARTRVRTFLETNPDAVDMNVRELADAAGVGKTVAAEVLKAWKDGVQ